MAQACCWLLLLSIFIIDLSRGLDGTSILFADVMKLETVAKNWKTESGTKITLWTYDQAKSNMMKFHRDIQASSLIFGLRIAIAQIPDCDVQLNSSCGKILGGFIHVELWVNRRLQSKKLTATFGDIHSAHTLFSTCPVLGSGSTKVKMKHSLLSRSFHSTGGEGRSNMYIHQSKMNSKWLGRPLTLMTGGWSGKAPFTKEHLSWAWKKVSNSRRPRWKGSSSHSWGTICMGTKRASHL